MKKIHLGFSELINSAIAFNLAETEGFEVCGERQDVDMDISTSDLLDGKIRIGHVLDEITRDYGAVFALGDLVFNTKAQLVSAGDVELKLTEKEAALLEKLVANIGYTARSEILQDVWGYADDVDTKTVESHAHRLNQKMADAFGVKIVEHKAGSYRLAEKS